MMPLPSKCSMVEVCATSIHCSCNHWQMHSVVSELRCKNVSALIPISPCTQLYSHTLWRACRPWHKEMCRAYIMHSHSGRRISNQQHSRVKPTTRPQQIYRQQMKQTFTWFLVLSSRFFFFRVNQTIFGSHVETPQKIHEIVDLCPISCTQTSRGLLKSVDWTMK